MTALEALQSVQYVTVNGRRLAIVAAGDWESLIALPVLPHSTCRGHKAVSNN